MVERRKETEQEALMRPWRLLCKCAARPAMVVDLEQSCRLSTSKSRWSRQGGPVPAEEVKEIRMMGVCRAADRCRGMSRDQGLTGAKAKRGGQAGNVQYGAAVNLKDWDSR